MVCVVCCAVRVGCMARLSSLPCARILVLGDSGVGKSSLVSAIAAAAANLTAPPHSAQATAAAHHTSPSPPSSAVSWTVGCVAVTVLLSMGGGGGSFVEWFDVGGHRRYSGSRSMFYRGVDGLLLVFDLTNRKSYNNLARWIREVVEVDRERSIQDEWVGGRAAGGGRGGSGGAVSGGVGGSGLSDLPVLVVGNKADMVEGGAGRGRRHFDCMADYGLEMATTSATQRGQSSLIALLPFIQRTIERKQRGRGGERVSHPISSGMSHGMIRGSSSATSGSANGSVSLYHRKASAAENGGAGGGGQAGRWRGEEADDEDDGDDGLTIDIAQLHTLAAPHTQQHTAHSQHHTMQPHTNTAASSPPASSSSSSSTPPPPSSASPLPFVSPLRPSSLRRFLPSRLSWLSSQKDTEPRSRV